MSDSVLASVHQLFNNEALRGFFTKLRVPLGVAAAAVVLWWVGIRREWFWPGLGISLAGALIQSWCFANLHKKKELACRGPYALVRNPMYLGRYFLVLGALILIGNPWILAAYTAFYWFYMLNRVRREEAILAPIFGAEYDRYRKSVARFVPGLRPFDGNPVLVFRWDLFLKNNGPVPLLAVALFYAAAAWFAFRPAA
jgi:protein-S-isoprenylcysteine O-methyltransferase Ste14